MGQKLRVSRGAHLHSKGAGEAKRIGHASALVSFGCCEKRGRGVSDRREESPSRPESRSKAQQTTARRIKQLRRAW